MYSRNHKTSVFYFVQAEVLIFLPVAFIVITIMSTVGGTLRRNNNSEMKKMSIAVP
jgi:hypothetical protein